LVFRTSRLQLQDVKLTVESVNVEIVIEVVDEGVVLRSQPNFGGHTFDQTFAHLFAHFRLNLVAFEPQSSLRVHRRPQQAKVSFPCTVHIVGNIVLARDSLCGVWGRTNNKFRLSTRLSNCACMHDRKISRVSPKVKISRVSRKKTQYRDRLRHLFATLGTLGLACVLLSEMMRTVSASIRGVIKRHDRRTPMLKCWN
jgi:hypothetical protein